MFKHYPHRFLKDKKEEGFTLIELLVVILIIGILSAIAIPAYMKQKSEAAAATLKTDLRNGAMIMTSESVKTGGLYGSAIPNYTDFSKGNLMSIVPESSNKDQFCLKGTNDSRDAPMYFSSKSGTMSEDADTCEETDSPSYSLINQDKKVYVVSIGTGSQSKEIMYSSLASLGYKSENIKEITTGTLKQQSFDNLDLLVLNSQAWAVENDDYVAGYEFYKKGGKVLMEGNDNRAYHFADSVWLNSSGIDFKPTYNSLSPAFPYSFKNTAFSADSSWYCLTGLKNNAVAIASSERSGHECISMFGATDSSGGQFIYIVMAAPQPKIEFSQTYAAMTWLMN